MRSTTELVMDEKIDHFIEALKASRAPPIYTLSPAQARQVLEDLQAQPIDKPQAHIEEKKVGQVSVRIIRPSQQQQMLTPIVYFHGGGWILGSAATHDRLARDLATGSQAAVIFVHYSPSPEANFPTPLEEAYAALQYVADNSLSLGFDAKRLTVAGDSVGGNMAIAMTLLAKERRGPDIHKQMLFYPVTSAELNTSSYSQFAEGPWLTKPAMEWFWNAYAPDASSRKNPLMSPLLASMDQLKGLPPALIITAENDVLRDEGEAYAHRLMQAGVPVIAMRVLGAIHDFMLLNPLAKTVPTQYALALAYAFMKR